MADGFRNTRSHRARRGRCLQRRASPTRSIFGRWSRGGTQVLVAHDLRNMPTLAASSPRWLFLGGGPAVFAGTRPFIVAIARIFRLVIGPLERKARAIELHSHVGGDTGVCKVEDNSISVGYIAGVVNARWTCAGVNDGSVVVSETSVPRTEISSASGGIGAVRRSGRIGRRIIRHARSLSGARFDIHGTGATSENLCFVLVGTGESAMLGPSVGSCQAQSFANTLQSSAVPDARQLRRAKMLRLGSGEFRSSVFLRPDSCWK